MCSPVELALLQGRYGVPAEKLCLAPFFLRPGQQSGAARRACTQAFFLAAPPCRVLWACRESIHVVITALSAMSPQPMGTQHVA